MYRDHFELSAQPFALSPKLDFLYRSGTFEESMAHLIYGLEQSEAVILITGAIGTGKTMAVQSFLSNLGTGFRTALVTNTRVSGRELLKLILDDLDVHIPRDADKSDLIIAFRETLLDASRNGQRVVVMVDEAQNLPVEALEEIRLLTNLGQGESQPVQIVLIGQPELDTLVQSPELAQLRQRIRVHYRLDPLSRRELGEYIDHRMKVAGCRKDVFERGAVDRIFDLSGGVPRLANTLANDALLAAFVAGGRKVTRTDVGVAEPREAAEKRDVPATKIDSTDSQPRQPRQFAHRSGKRRANLIPVFAVVAVVAVAAVGFNLLGWTLPDWGSSAGGEPVATPQSTLPMQQKVPTADGGLEVREQTADEDAFPDSALPSTVAVPAAGPADEEVGQPEPELPVTDPGASDPFCVHIGSFRAEARAQAFVTQLAERTGGAFQRFDDVRGAGWYRVFVGPYEGRDTALAAARLLTEEMGLDYYRVVEIEMPTGR